MLFGSLLPLLPQAVLASKGGSDYYEALGLSCDAKLADVRKAYRREALEWHPDKKPERRREEAEERFRRIAEAYAVLSNSYARSRYDRQRRSPFCGFFGSDFGDTGGQSDGKDFNFEDFSFTFESAEDIFRQFFGDEDPFAEAKEHIQKGQEMMMDAMREGEAIASRLARDLLKNFVGEPGAGDARARGGRQERAQRAREHRHRAKERAAKRPRDRAEGRERLREERQAQAEERAQRRHPSADEWGRRTKQKAGKTTQSRHDSSKAQDAFETAQRKQRRDFKRKNRNREEYPEFDFASVREAGMRAFQSMFEDRRPEL